MACERGYDVSRCASDVMQNEPFVFRCANEQLDIYEHEGFGIWIDIRTLESYDHATDRTDIAWELNAVARALDSRSKINTWPDSDARAMRFPSGLWVNINSR